MAEDVIKLIKTQNSETFRIGADAQDIDYNENVKLTEVIGNNLNETSLSERIQNSENSITNLINTFNDISLQIAALITQTETQDQKIQQLQTEKNNLVLEVLELKQPALVKNIEWDAMNHTNLREILGNLVNVPYGSVRNWLENLQNQNIVKHSNMWHSIADTEEQTPNVESES